MKIEIANGSVIEYMEKVEATRGNRSRDVLWLNAEENEEKEEESK